ncbi:hypothetical protein PC116_g15652 [Phytophthora cactorum]|nr:hypothetical protein PC116_g15652 [Phytophthora cactorum]
MSKLLCTARCSNAPIARTTLKLFDTGRFGLGVYTTTSLDVENIVGEYTGELKVDAAQVVLDDAIRTGNCEAAHIIDANLK